MSELDNFFDMVEKYFPTSRAIETSRLLAKREATTIRARIAELEKTVDEAEKVIGEYAIQEGATFSASDWLKKYGGWE